MWHELNVVLHTRQAAQATLGWRAWAKDEAEGTKALNEIWDGVAERLKRMPIE
jgi:sorting nexin-8